MKVSDTVWNTEVEVVDTEREREREGERRGVVIDRSDIHIQIGNGLIGCWFEQKVCFFLESCLVITVVVW
jgi:hypothetical protein